MIFRILTVWSMEMTQNNYLDLQPVVRVYRFFLSEIRMKLMHPG
jgi:hypothetical protein